jgi:hypothetical protein
VAECRTAVTKPSLFEHLAKPIPETGWAFVLPELPL